MNGNIVQVWSATIDVTDQWALESRQQANDKSLSQTAVVEFASRYQVRGQTVSQIHTMKLQQAMCCKVNNNLTVIN